MRRALFGVAMLFSVAARGQNLVVNGTFDRDISGWTAYAGGARWDGDDSHGNRSSGSIAVGGSGIRYASQCVQAVPNATTYWLRASGKGNNLQIYAKPSKYPCDFSDGSVAAAYTALSVRDESLWTGSVAWQVAAQPLPAWLIVVETVGDGSGSADDIYFGTQPPAEESLRLVVAKSGSGTGTVTSAGGSISCGTSCSGVYPFGTLGTLTATASADSVFAGWSGDCSGSSVTCRVTMTQDRTVIARFEKSMSPLQCGANVPSSSEVLGAARFNASIGNTGAEWADVTWSFGDGSSDARGGDLRHSYLRPGKYNWTMAAKTKTRSCQVGRQIDVSYPDLGQNFTFVKQAQSGALVYSTSLAWTDGSLRDQIAHQVFFDIALWGAGTAAFPPSAGVEAIISAADLVGNVIWDVSRWYDPVAVAPMRGRMSLFSTGVDSTLTASDRYVAPIVYLDFIRTQFSDLSQYSSGLYVALAGGDADWNSSNGGVELLTRAELQSLDLNRGANGKPSRSFLVLSPFVFDASKVTAWNTLLGGYASTINANLSAGAKRDTFFGASTHTASTHLRLSFDHSGTSSQAITLQASRTEIIKPPVSRASNLIVSFEGAASSQSASPIASAASAPHVSLEVFDSGGILLFTRELDTNSMNDIDVSACAPNWYYTLTSDSDLRGTAVFESWNARRRVVTH